MPADRDSAGRFMPGVSGNPAGGKKKDPAAMEILRAAVPKAARKLVALLECGNAKIEAQAATAILDRVWGKPTQAQEIHMEGNMDLRAEVRAALLERARVAGCEVGMETGTSAR